MDPPSPIALTTQEKLLFSFAAAGWLQMYHFGVAKAIQDLRIDRHAFGVRFAGSSAGSLAAAGIVSRISFDDLKEYALDCCDDCRSKLWNAFQIRRYVRMGIKIFVVDKLRDAETRSPRGGVLTTGIGSDEGSNTESSVGDEATILRQRLNDQLDVYVSVLPWCRSKIISEFEDAEDLEEALVASCCLTPLAGFPFQLRKTGEWVCDGGLTAFQPGKHEFFYFSESDHIEYYKHRLRMWRYIDFTGEKSIMSPTAFSTNKWKAGSPLLKKSTTTTARRSQSPGRTNAAENSSAFPQVDDPKMITVSPLYFTSANIRPSQNYIPAWWGLYPPSRSRYSELYDIGYRDAVHYFVKSNLLSKNHPVVALVAGVSPPLSSDYSESELRQIQDRLLAAENSAKNHSLFFGDRRHFSKVWWALDALTGFVFFLIFRPIALFVIYGEMLFVTLGFLFILLLEGLGFLHYVRVMLKLFSSYVYSFSAAVERTQHAISDVRMWVVQSFHLVQPLPSNTDSPSKSRRENSPITPGGRKKKPQLSLKDRLWTNQPILRRTSAGLINKILTALVWLVLFPAFVILSLLKSTLEAVKQWVIEHPIRQFYLTLFQHNQQKFPERRPPPTVSDDSSAEALQPVGSALDGESMSNDVLNDPDEWTWKLVLTNFNYSLRNVLSYRVWLRLLIGDRVHIDEQRLERYTHTYRLLRPFL